MALEAADATVKQPGRCVRAAGNALLTRSGAQKHVCEAIGAVSPAASSLQQPEHQAKPDHSLAAALDRKGPS